MASWDARLHQAARDTLAQSIGRLDGIVERGQAVDRLQRTRLIHAGSGLLAGMLIWSFLPGAIARSLPESWHVPEWMAARTLGLEEKAATRRMVLSLRERGDGKAN